MGEVAELLQNLLELLADVVESLCGLWIRELAGQADSDAECDQMLLRSVMEVALDLAALGVARRPRCVHASRGALRSSTGARPSSDRCSMASSSA